MSHERSETVEIDGRWYNTKPTRNISEVVRERLAKAAPHGEILQGPFSTLALALAAARLRSRQR